MELLQKSCQTCGGDLKKLSATEYKCCNCGNLYSEESAEQYADKMSALFDEMKLEALSNARRNLYEAVTADNISSVNVHECCVILKQLLPDDFQANFYEVAIGDNARAIARAIRAINVEENRHCIETVINFLIASLSSEFVTETADLIERAFKMTDLRKYRDLATKLSKEAEKIDNCIYLTNYPRDVFIAYSSKDMKIVLELAEQLEAQGISCFVALRNLRHGAGSVENYDRALQEAMDNCTSFVFVSSTNSRHAG